MPAITQQHPLLVQFLIVPPGRRANLFTLGKVHSPMGADTFCCFSSFHHISISLHFSSNPSLLQTPGTFPLSAFISCRLPISTMQVTLEIIILFIWTFVVALVKLYFLILGTELNLEILLFR